MHQKCIKNALNRLHDASKRLPRRLQDGPRRILPPFWAPTWGQVGAMLATFPAQGASMTPPRASQDAAKNVPRTSTTWADGVPLFWSPKADGVPLFWSPRLHGLFHFWTIFLLIFGLFLMDLWLIFGGDELG